MTINVKIELPESLKSHIEEEIARGRYENFEAYLQKLIFEDQIRQAEDELDQKLLAGLNSGESSVADEEFWKKLKADAIERNRK